MKHQSRYSLSRIEKLIGRVMDHSQGKHLKKLSDWQKTNPQKRGSAVLQKLHTAGRLQKRKMRLLMLGSK